MVVDDRSSAANDGRRRGYGTDLVVGWARCPDFRWWLAGPVRPGCSGQQLGQDLRTLDSCEALIQTLELEAQPCVIDTQAMQDGGIQVVDVHRFVHDVVAEIVGLAVDKSAFAATYDDSKWSTGRDSRGPEGGFGFGAPVGVEFEGLYYTAYFRHRFSTEQPSDELIFSCQLDDGAIIYLDGKKVGRVNVAEGSQEAYELPPMRNVEGNVEAWVGFYRLSGSLDPGEHILAFSLHNTDRDTSDLRVAEISLWGTPQLSIEEPVHR